MKEFIEKLIARLEELQNYACFPSEFVSEEQEKVYSFFAKKLTEILKFAEEHKTIDVAELVEKFGQEKAQSNNGWIPCSERLPEESGEYLTYVDYADETFIAIDEFDCEGILKEWNGTPNYHILAWQPLPEPYREEFD